AATALNIKTFAPKTSATFTGGDVLDMMRYLTLVKKPAADGSTRTIGFGVTGDLGENSRKLVALDLTNPTQPVVLSLSPANDYQRLTIVRNVHDLQTQGDNPCGGGLSFSGDLELVSTYSQVGSAVRFFDVTDPSKPCQLGAKLLTLNPAQSDGSEQGVVFTGLGFARGIATLPNGDRLNSYTAVENVGIMLVD